MNVLINNSWYYAIKISDKNEFAVEISEDQLPVFNKIKDDAHRTHGMAQAVNIPYALLLQETIKGKTTSKCVVGVYNTCVLNSIAPNYHKDNTFAIFNFAK